MELICVFLVQVMLSTKGSPTKFYKVYDLEEGDLYKPGKEDDTPPNSLQCHQRRVLSL
jgi:hypothetical protein